MKTLLTTTLLATLAVTMPTAQETVAYKAKTLIVSPARTFTNGILLVRDGKILDCGTDLAIPTNTKIVDLPDAVIAPGFIDTWSRFGSSNEGVENQSPFTPSMKIADGLNLHDRKWGFFPFLGVTSVIVAPHTQQVAGGLSCLVKTGRKPQVVMSSLNLQLSISGTARVKERPPTSLPGQLTLIRSHFSAVEQMLKKKTDIPWAPLQVIAQAIQGKIPVGIICNTPHEVLAGTALAQKTGPNPFLIIGMGHRHTARIMKSSGVGAVLLPVGKEAPAWRLRLPGQLAAAGVPVAFGSGLPNGAMISFRSRAARAINYGMTKTQAYAAVTSTPAKLLGLSHMIGTLEKGRDADFIILDGHPLNPASRIKKTFIEGRKVYAAARKKEAGK